MSTKLNILVWNVMNLSNAIERPGDFGNARISERATLIGKMIGAMPRLPDLIIFLETGSDGAYIGWKISTAAATGTTAAYRVVLSQPTANREGPETYTMLLNEHTQNGTKNQVLLDTLDLEIDRFGFVRGFDATKFPIVSKLHKYRGGWKIPLQIGSTQCNLGIIHGPFSTPVDVALPAWFKPSANKNILNRMAVSYEFAQQLGANSILAGDFNIPAANNQHFRELLAFNHTTSIPTPAPVKFSEWGPQDKNAQPENTSLRQLYTIINTQPPFVLNPYDQAYATAQAKNKIDASSSVVSPPMTDRFTGRDVQKTIDGIEKKLLASLIGLKPLHHPTAPVDVSIDPAKPANADVTTAIDQRELPKDFDFAASWQYVNKPFPANNKKRKTGKNTVSMEQRIEGQRKGIIKNLVAVYKLKVGGNNLTVGTGHLVAFCQMLVKAQNWRAAVELGKSFAYVDIPASPDKDYYALYRSVISDHLPINIEITVP